MIALRALRLAMIVFVLLCIVMTLLAEFQRLTTAHAQTTLTPGVTQGASLKFDPVAFVSKLP
jgi:hypothetical protein